MKLETPREESGTRWIRPVRLALEALDGPASFSGIEPLDVKDVPGRASHLLEQLLGVETLGVRVTIANRHDAWNQLLLGLSDEAGVMVRLKETPARWERLSGFDGNLLQGGELRFRFRPPAGAGEGELRFRNREAFLEVLEEIQLPIRQVMSFEAHLMPLSRP
jgi:hypothetical protein